MARSRQSAAKGEGEAAAESGEREPSDFPPPELEAEMGRELPDREAMSLVNANVAIPIDAAVAANVLSDNSHATAEHDIGDIDQAN